VPELTSVINPSWPDHTKLSVRFQPWNYRRLCSELDVGPPLFTLLTLETLTDSARSGWCDQPLILLGGIAMSDYWVANLCEGVCRYALRDMFEGLFGRLERCFMTSRNCWFAGSIKIIASIRVGCHLVTDGCNLRSWKRMNFHVIDTCWIPSEQDAAVWNRSGVHSLHCETCSGKAWSSEGAVIWKIWESLRCSLTFLSSLMCSLSLSLCAKME
jgi:hypothetical protein